MGKSKITSSVTELPDSCKSAMEHMERELRAEDEACESVPRRQFEVADLPDSCEKQIHEFERELNKDGYWNIALVAYQMKDSE